MEVYLNLGLQPLANAYLPPDFTGEEFRAPLAVQACLECGLSQLTHVVRPEVLYANYKFRSGVNPAWREHCRALAQGIEITDGRPADADVFVVDIAANDGALLEACQERGWRVLGVEPAEIPASVPIVRAWWNLETAQEVVHAHGEADIVISQNVLGHVDDVQGFVAGVDLLLKERGIWIIEVPSADELIRDHAFETVYHEHLTYWTLAPLQTLLRPFGLAVAEMSFLDVHCGSYRFVVVREETRREWAPLVAVRQRRIMESLAKATRPLWAYGASAKGTVMLNALQAAGNTVWPEAVVDDTVEKQGLLVPGVRIPIVPPQDLSHVQTLWILSWNWREQLEERARELGFQGTFL